MSFWRKKTTRRRLIPLPSSAKESDALNVLHDHNALAGLFLGPRLIGQDGSKYTYSNKESGDSSVQFTNIDDGVTTYESIGLSIQVFLRWRVIVLDSDSTCRNLTSNEHKSCGHLALEEVMEYRCLRVVANLLDLHFNSTESTKTWAIVRAIELRSNDPTIGQTELVSDAREYVKIFYSVSDVSPAA